jgi:hypothetical protein
LLARSLCFSFIALVCVALIACGAQKDLEAAAAAVTQFHTQVQNQDYVSVYNQADPRLRNVTRQEDFVALLTAVHNKLGAVQTALQNRFFVNYTTSGEQITLTYVTKFSGGDANEQFLWAKQDGKIVLLGYHINSNALITK